MLNNQKLFAHWLQKKTIHSINLHPYAAPLPSALTVCTLCSVTYWQTLNKMLLLYIIHYGWYTKPIRAYIYTFIIISSISDYITGYSRHILLTEGQYLFAKSHWSWKGMLILAIITYMVTMKKKTGKIMKSNENLYMLWSLKKGILASTTFFISAIKKMMK